MQSNEIRSRFLKFFEKRGHAIIPSASLVPENDPSTLFNTAGMQPLVPYLLGQPHPAGTRIADCQKCVRTGDIDDVGDNRHCTFFEMLGNWSLGDYFKKESLPWSFDFLTSKEEGLGLDPKRFYVTVFKGESGIPRDEEAIKIWQEIFTKYGIKAEVAGDDGVINDDVRIIPLGVDDNFWIAGATGPCGGDSEFFYDTRPEEGKLGGKFQDLVDSYRLLEVWNNVFMEFDKTADGKYEPLAKKNVDTGMGLERTTAVVNGKSTVFDTDLFETILAKISELSLCHCRLPAQAGAGRNPDSDFNSLDPRLHGDDNTETIRASRIVADHIRTAVFMIADGVVPANTDRGYVLRRILRRAIRYSDLLKIPAGSLSSFADIVAAKYGEVYTNLVSQSAIIKQEIDKEEQKFRQTLDKGMREISKLLDKQQTISGKEAFDLYQTYGFPIEVTNEIAKERGIKVDEQEYNQELKKHQELSKAGAEQKFKGGLGGSSERIVKYHTATHLLQQALTDVLGPQVAQKGSNITDERLRFDFSFDRKMTDEEKKQVEDIVNQKISEDLPVKQVILPKEEAEKTGARHLFGEKYGDQVSLYYIGNTLDAAYSKEFCGGPHVEHTGVLGHFKIAKEEAVAAGIRRIKAVLE